MTWWLRSHRMPGVAAAILVATILGPLVGGTSLLFPSLSGASPFQGIPLAAVTPLISAAAISSSVTAATRGPYPVATRPVCVGDVLISLATVALGALAALLAFADPSSVATARNTTGLVGLQLIAGRLAGYRFQTIVPVLFVFASALLGRTADGSVAAWAWPATTSSEIGYWIAPALLLTIGTATSMRAALRGRPPGSPAGPGFR